jgi:hypothetical protein
VWALVLVWVLALELVLVLVSALLSAPALVPASDLPAFSYMLKPAAQTAEDTAEAVCAVCSFTYPAFFRIKENSPHADHRFVLIEIPAVERISEAVLRTAASPAFFAGFRQRPPEDLKPVVPDVLEAVFEYIPLDRFGTPLNIETRPNISVRHDAGSIDTGIAQPVPVSDLRLIIEAEIMTAAEFQGIPLFSFFPDEVKETDIVFLRAHQFRPLEGSADRLEMDYPPGINIDLIHDIKQGIQLIDILMVDDGRDLDIPESLFIDQALNTPHGPPIAAFHTPESVMRFFQTID